MRLVAIMIYVNDLPRMRTFYSSMLGIEPHNTEWLDAYAEYAAGGTTFALHAIPAEIAATIKIESPPRPREQGAVKFTFESRVSKDQMPAERARLEQLGAQFLLRPWGDWDGVDPEGNVFGFRASFTKDELK